jgi:hypothetical protein
MQVAPVTPTATRRQRFEIEVEAILVDHIRNCLASTDADEITVAPIISGWGVQGYWSSEHTFSNIGKKVVVRFNADPGPLQPLLRTGFGILAMTIIPISATDIDLKRH